MVEGLEGYPRIVGADKEQACFATTSVPGAIRGGALIAINNAPADGRIKGSSAGMQSTGEEEDFLGSLEMGFRTEECINVVKPGTEEEGVKSGAPSYTLNANQDTITLVAAYAGQEYPIAEALV